MTTVAGIVVVGLVAAACSSGSGGSAAPDTSAAPSTGASTTAEGPTSTNATTDATKTATTEPTTEQATDATVDATNDPVTTETASSDTTSDSGDRSAFYDNSVLHTIEVSFDQGDYDDMIDAYTTSRDKAWIEADVVIDGVSYRQVGLRLKGNSSLSGLGGGPLGGRGADDPASTDTTDTTASTDTTDTTDTTDVAARGPVGGGPAGGIGSASADEPERLPWLIRLDKYIDDQAHQGLTELVVRSSSTETGLNEAVSLALLREAGLATQRAVSAKFTVNDRPSVLRLVVENPNDDWASENLGDGPLYKADASGDYSYRGDDPEDYGDAWEQEAGEDDLTPLIDFLDFINNSSDETFAAELSDHLDVEAFADYLAIEDLLANFDDISGPGNNSYLYFDRKSERFTVVAWDHNLALSQFGAMGGGGEGGFDPAQIPGGTLPEGFDPAQIPGGTLPDGFDPAQIPGGTLPEGFDPTQIPGALGRGNALADRFMENETFAALYEDALATLRADLYESGRAQAILTELTDSLLATATSLVDAATIEQESSAVAGFFVPE